MAVNADKPTRWKADIAQSVDFYNAWFLDFAPEVFRTTRREVTESVKDSIMYAADMRGITPALLRQHPLVLPALRSATAPPIARDRLSGLAGVSRVLINSLELEGRLPPKTLDRELDQLLDRICSVIDRLLDRDIFPWLAAGKVPVEAERERAATIVADRLTGATANPLIRNAQEKRQLQTIKTYLEGKGYRQAGQASGGLTQMQPSTFAFRRNVRTTGGLEVNIPIDVIVQPHNLREDGLPILIEAKSAGDFTNTNKRRKEEATKMRQLQATLGENVPFILFLNGYFDSGYLGYEAAEGIDWVWEHRIDDLVEFGI